MLSNYLTGLICSSLTQHHSILITNSGYDWLQARRIEAFLACFNEQVQTANDMGCKYCRFVRARYQRVSLPATGEQESLETLKPNLPLEFRAIYLPDFR